RRATAAGSKARRAIGARVGPILPPAPSTTRSPSSRPSVSITPAVGSLSSSSSCSTPAIESGKGTGEGLMPGYCTTFLQSARTPHTHPSPPPHRTSPRLVDTQLSVYNHPGRSTMAKKRRTYTPEFKAEAVKLVAERREHRGQADAGQRHRGQDGAAVPPHHRLGPRPARGRQPPGPAVRSRLPERVVGGRHHL